MDPEQTSTVDSSSGEAEATQETLDPRAAAEAAIKQYAEEHKSSDSQDTPVEQASDEPAPEEKPEPKVAAVMRAKQQAQAIRERAEQEAQRRLQEAEARLSRVHELERQAQEAERYKSALTKLRESPIDGLRELGYDPKEFFRKALNEPGKLDPNEHFKSELAKVNERLEQEKRERENWIRRQEQERIAREQAEIEHSFLRVSLNEEKYPHLSTLYGPGGAKQLLSEAEAVGQEFHRRTGEWASFEEISDYLEQEAANRYRAASERLSKFKSGQKQDQSSGEGSRAGKPAGKKTLSNATVSTKATAPKRPEDMTKEELNAEAARAAQAAIEQERATRAT